MTMSMTRRGFLTAGAAAATAASLPAPGTAKAAPNMSNWRKAVKYGMVSEGDSVLTKFQLVKDLGFDGIELDSPNGLDRQEVLDARDQTELPIHGVVDSAHWSKPFSHPDPKVRAEGVRALEIALDDCKAYGGDTVLVVPAVVKKISAIAMPGCDRVQRSCAWYPKRRRWV